MVRRVLTSAKRTKNPGEGNLFYFHGAFSEKKDAQKKQATVPGSFVRTAWYRHGMRYAVLTPIRPMTAPNPNARLVRWKKPISQISDRQKQVRAHHPAFEPKGPKQCAKCGSRKNVVLDHKDGNESNLKRSNLRWLCTSCNTREGIRNKRLGKGVRVRKYKSQLRPKVGSKVRLTKPIPLPRRKKNSLALKALKHAAKAISAIASKKKNTSLTPGTRVVVKQTHVSGSDRETNVPGVVISPAEIGISQAPVGRVLVRHRLGRIAVERFYPSDNLRVANPKRKAAKKCARRNPETAQQAAKVYQTFHGRAVDRFDEIIVAHGLPANVVEQLKALVPPEDYAKLGDLVSLLTREGRILFHEGERPILATNPDANRLYLIAGNQNIDPMLGQLKAKTDKGMVDLGECLEIEYFTRKKFDQFKPVIYYHAFGEESGKRPRLMYDRKRRQLHLVGGNYKIKNVGIVD